MELLVTRPFALGHVLWLGVALAACSRGDARMEKLAVGIPKDSALAVLGVAKPDRIDPYVVGGHYIEALYIAKPGADSGSTPDRQMTPVVAVDGNLVGWGWKYWDSVATVHHIVVAQPEKQ
jgi:hypothetical protein